MKKSLWFLVIIIIVVGIALLVWPVDEQRDAGKDRKARVTMLSERVSLRHSPTAAFNDISDTVEVKSGATVRTASSGRALVEFSTTTRTTVDSNATFTIAHADRSEDQYRIELVAGQVWSRLKKTLEQGGYYKIETQNGVATVRGTSFNVSVSDGTTSVTVTEGDVVLAKRDPNTEAVLPDTQKAVTAGKTGKVSKTSAVSVSETPEHIKNSEWYQKNVSDVETSTTTTDNENTSSDEQNNSNDTSDTTSATRDPATDVTDETTQQTRQATQEQTETEQETTPSFSISRMSTSSLQLRLNEPDILTISGYRFDGVTDVALYGQGDAGDAYVVDDLRETTTSTVRVAVPYEIPNGTYRVFVRKSEDTAAIAPTDLEIGHVEPEQKDSEELQG